MEEENGPASVFFEQPINFVRNIKEGRHIVLFYEEPEYAELISFQFIKSGLEYEKVCCYITENDLEIVKKEMTDIGIDVNKFIMNGLLQVHQVLSLNDYNPKNPPANKNGLENTLSSTRLAQTERLVFRYTYDTNTEDQIKSILKWEREYRLKHLKNGTTAFLCTYPVDNIIPVLFDSAGALAKWMNDLLTMYDGVIFARRLWKGVAFNLD
jgi:MEDS: MEthanogen/methylotroph, DcmR Sensory domain